jgi:hypothetical protein
MVTILNKNPRMWKLPIIVDWYIEWNKCKYKPLIIYIMASMVG